MWLGGNDHAIDGDWRWVSDNSVITFDIWYPGQPDGTQNGDEDCVYMDKFTPKSADGTCERPLAFFCQWIE